MIVIKNAVLLIAIKASFFTKAFAERFTIIFDLISE